VTVNVADLEKPDRVAVITAGVSAATDAAVNVTVTDFKPAGIVTEDGIFAAAVEDDSAIAVPPAGAASGIVTVKVAVRPPATLDGVTVTE
jgi:hypothetical protein